MNRFRYLSPKRCQGGGSPSTSLLQYSAFSAVVALVATAQSAAAGSFTFTTLNYPGASGGTQAVGINNSGQIVGQSLDVSNQYDSAGWLYSGGTFSSPIVYPNAPTYCGMPYGGAASTTNGINNSAVVVGDYSLYCATPRYGFTYSGGSFTQLNVSPGISTTINGINDSGELVGSSYLNGSTTYSGYFDLGGNVTIFSVLGANFTNANGVNNAGDIVGSYSIQNGGIQNGFLDIGGNFTTIDDPLGVGGTVPEGLNNEGEIVGYYADGSGGATRVHLPEWRLHHTRRPARSMSQFRMGAERSG